MKRMTYVKLLEGESAVAKATREAIEEIFSFASSLYRSKTICKKEIKNKYFPHQGKKECERRRG
jgi:hypothetical protein